MRVTEINSIDGDVFRVVNSNIFDTNNHFKAMVVVENMGEHMNKKSLSCVLEQDFDIDIKTYIPIEIDFVEGTGHWSLAYICSLDADYNE